MISGRITDIDASGYLTIGEINNPVHPVESEDKYYADLDPTYFEKISESTVCPPELENVFKKSDLQVGDIVVCRDGSREKVRTYSDSSYIRFETWSIDLWNDDLTFHSNTESSRKNDIVKIERTQVFEINQVVKETLDIAGAEKLLASLGHNVVIK